jgi:N-acetylmuramoyl-L-alanine amidase
LSVSSFTLPCFARRKEAVPSGSMTKLRDRFGYDAVSRFSFLTVILLSVLLLASCVSPYKQGAGKFSTVIIDAGHGGHDRGGRPTWGSPEKVLALDTARRLATILRAKGFRVVETRSGDVFIPLESRIKTSNATRSGIFVSIHYNWAPRRGARGIEVHYYSPRSWRLASNILRETTGAYRTASRGVKRNSFRVLQKNRRPAVLCELGFLSNSQDNRFAQSSRSRQRLAEAVAAAIVKERQSAGP